MNDKIVLDFGSIVSQMESEGLRLLTVKDNNSLFVVDGKDNLYAIEPYYAGGYLDKFIGERNVISFELIEQPAINFEDWRKKFLDAAWVKDFIERIVKTEYPDFEDTSPLASLMQSAAARTSIPDINTSRSKGIDGPGI